MNATVYGPGGEGMFGFVLFAMVAIILIASWIVLAGSRFVQGGVVEHPRRVPQLYGYTMCLVGILVGLSSFISIVEHTLTLADPAHTPAEWTNWGEPSLTSFEAFRATYERTQDYGGMPPMRSIPEDELRRRYEGMRAARIEQNQVQATRGLIISVISFLIGTGLFAFHWRWLRRHVEGRGMSGPESPGVVEGAMVTR